MIKAIKSFTSSLNAANRMGKAPIFLKHRAKNVGRVIANNKKTATALGATAAGGIYLSSSTNKQERY